MMELSCFSGRKDKVVDVEPALLIQVKSKSRESSVSKVKPLAIRKKSSPSWNSRKTIVPKMSEEQRGGTPSSSKRYGKSSQWRSPPGNSKAKLSTFEKTALQRNTNMKDATRPERSMKSPQVSRPKISSTIRRLQRRKFRSMRTRFAVRHLEYFLSFLYYIGLSPLKPNSALRLPRWTQRLQKALYWLFACISIIQVLDEVKYGWFQLCIERDMQHFVYMGFYVATCMTRIYSIYLFATSEKRITKLVEKINRVNSKETSDRRTSDHLVIICIGITSILLSGLSTILGDVALSEWTFQTVIRERSYELSESLFIWSSNNYTQKSHELAEIYASNMTTTTILFAGTASNIAFVGTLHACVILDLFPIVTLQVYIFQLSFTSQIHDDTKEGKLTAECPLSAHWKHYMELRCVCDEIDKAFGKLLKLIHGQNMLLFCYFLLKVLENNLITAEFMVNLVSVLKVWMTYYLVQKLADENDYCEECVTKCSELGTTISLNGVERNVTVVLNDMKKHPIGIGRGDFFVNEAFLLKFAGAIGSIFLLLSGESAKKSG